MNVELLRKDSGGIKATYDNADHHAKRCIPFIKKLEELIPTLGFDKWVQGNSVHKLVTKDGRQFDLVGYVDNNEYKGIELRLRQSRSVAIRLSVLTKMSELQGFASLLRALAMHYPENQRRGFKLAA